MSEQAVTRKRFYGVLRSLIFALLWSYVGLLGAFTDRPFHMLGGFFISGLNGYWCIRDLLRLDKDLLVAEQYDVASGVS